MKKIKVTILSVALIAMLFTAAAYATVGSRVAELAYNNIKIMLDGKEVVPKDASGNTIEPFVIDGTTYLPVRGISSALGLGVSWNASTGTVELNTPGAFPGAVKVYEDDKVTIEFAGCTLEKLYEWSDIQYYHANFNIKNKTDVELTFQTSSLSFNGFSYNSFVGSDHVAPQSTGKVDFYTETQLPTSGIYKTSGQIRVIDFSKSALDDKYSYEAKWVDVTQ